MRCVTCGSVLPEDPRTRCVKQPCAEHLCPGEYGVECRAFHEKQAHPEAPVTGGTIGDYVRNLKRRVEAAESAALEASGRAIHWKATNHATEVNWKAKFSALVKFMKAACPDKLDYAIQTKLCSMDDIIN